MTTDFTEALMRLKMKNLTFSKVSLSMTALALLAVFGLVGCGSGGGGGGNAGTTETTSPPKTYMLTVDKFGEGIVTSDISGVNCGDDCSEAHNEGTTVVLTATSSSTNGYQFSSWAGCDSISGNTCTVTMDKDKTVLPSYTHAPILYGTTKIIDDATLQYLIKREGGTFYFDSQATTVSNVIPGDIIAGSTEMGFLRKVTATSISSDGLIVIETTDATLEEAIQEGTVTFTKQLTNADLMSSQLRKGVSLRKAKALNSTEFTFDFDNVVYDFENKSPMNKAVGFDTSVGALNISGSTTLTFEPDFGIDFIKEYGIPTGVKEFKTILLITQKNDLKITVSDNVEVSEKIKIGTLTFGPYPIAYTPIGIPFIWLTPEFNIYIGVDGSVEATLTTSASLTNYLTTGIKYTNDKGWGPIGTYSKDVGWEQPTLTASASIESYVSPECVIWINSVVGPYVNLKGYLGLTGNASTDLSSYELLWRLYYGIDATAGVRVKIIGISLGDYSVDIFDPNPEWELASGGIYSLVISKTGTGTGTVTSSPTGISCGTDCSKNYKSGTQVTLTPTASSGSTFVGWSGGGCSGTGTCTVTTDAAKMVYATFNLTTSTAPSISAFTINNEASSATSRTVTLNNTATGSPTQYMASESSSFNGTSWQTYSTAPSFTLSSGNATKTVYFKVKNSTGESTAVSDSIALNEGTTQYTLTVTKSGTGSGTVSATGLSCGGSTCTGSYSQGTSVTLSASASSGSTFAGWSGGGCSGTGTCTATMNVATTITATFNSDSTPTVSSISPTTFSSSTTPYSPVITVYGTSLDQIASVKYSWTGATSGGPTTGYWASTGTTSRTLNPTVLTSGDPSGTSTWTVRFYNSLGSEIAGTSKTFTVTYTVTTTLTVNGIASSYFATSGTYQPAISLSGSGFNSVNQVYLTCAKNSISCGNYTWTSANWSGKFAVINDTSAVFSPVLTVSSDPAGTYNWSATFSGGGQSVTKNFTVTK